MFPNDPKFQELLARIPQHVLRDMAEQEGESPEELGLGPAKPDPKRGRVVIVFAQEFFRGESRILLDMAGGLPHLRLPWDHTAADFIQSHSRELFNSPIINCRQVGSLEVEEGDFFIVTGDVLTPAACLDDEYTYKGLMWTPTCEIVRFQTLQSIVIAFCQTRLSGWHIFDSGGKSFRMSFRMKESPVAPPEEPQGTEVAGGEEFQDRFSFPKDPHGQEEYPNPCSDDDVKN